MHWFFLSIIRIWSVCQFSKKYVSCTSVLQMKGFLQYNSYIQLKVKLGREEWGLFFSFPRNECDSLLGLMGVFPSNKVQWNSQMSELSGGPACNYSWVTLFLPSPLYLLQPHQICQKLTISFLYLILSTFERELF